MGVTYKLKEEVVSFIIDQRKSNPLLSCRQLAESASEKFGLHLSKSSVHDVLKESGVVTPRGRKPKDKFEIPKEKKKQIQVSLAQAKLEPVILQKPPIEIVPPPAPDHEIKLIPLQEEVSTPPPLVHKEEEINPNPLQEVIALPPMPAVEMVAEEVISEEYAEAGRIFYKAAIWDLGIYSKSVINDMDWAYYLTYAKGVKVELENDRNFFIDYHLPIERCIREVADGLINNIKPFIVHKVLDEEGFKASMDAQKGFNIHKITIVGENNHILFEYDGIVEHKREYLIDNMLFMESNENNFLKRAMMLFFSQSVDNPELINSLFSLKGFDTITSKEIIVTLLTDNGYGNLHLLQEAAKKLNAMYLQDEEGKLVKVKIKSN